MPTFDEVRDKIEARYAKAKGIAELGDSAVEGRMIEIEQATHARRGAEPARRDPPAARPPAADAASGALGTGAAAGAAAAPQSGELGAGAPAEAAPQAEPTQQVPSDPA